MKFKQGMLMVSILSKIDPGNCPFPARKCEWCITYKFLSEDDCLSKYSIELTWEELEDRRLIWLKGRGGASFYFSNEFEIPLAAYCVTKCTRNQSECLICCLKKIGIKCFTRAEDGKENNFEVAFPLAVYNAKHEENVVIKTGSRFWRCRDRESCSDAFCEYYDLCKTMIKNEKLPFTL